MEGLGGGGISFIKRVSVKGFLFLPSPPHHLPLVRLPFRGCWHLAAAPGAQQWDSSPSPPLAPHTPHQRLWEGGAVG